LTQACPKFKAQQEFGELFQNSIDYHTFRTYSVAVEFLVNFKRNFLKLPQKNFRAFVSKFTPTKTTIW